MSTLVAVYSLSRILIASYTKVTLSNLLAIYLS